MIHFPKDYVRAYPFDLTSYSQSPTNGFLDGVSGNPLSCPTSCKCAIGYTTGPIGGCVPLCTAGHYMRNDGTCTTCTAGTFSSGGAVTSCTQCDANTFSGDGASSCTPCGGTSTSDPGSSSCHLNCVPGQFANNGACADCPAGSFSGAGATSCTHATLTIIRVLNQAAAPYAPMALCLQLGLRPVPLTALPVNSSTITLAPPAQRERRATVVLLPRAIHAAQMRSRALTIAAVYRVLLGRLLTMFIRPAFSIALPANLFRIMLVRPAQRERRATVAPLPRATPAVRTRSRALTIAAVYRVLLGRPLTMFIRPAFSTALPASSSMITLARPAQ
ncbi:hypothetical protein DFH06DRAFT_1086433 [Mycena polygramma]|nr:hypothetical protein DFH06DRAFT_1086433 [Mycena polygramma]